VTAHSDAALKAELRQQLRERRQQMPAHERHLASLRIADKLLRAVDWPSIHSLHIYRSLPAWGEVETAPIIRTVGERWPAIEIVSPGLAADQPIPSRPFDLIVVPVLGFDADNFRLGLGAGFYDRFLAGQPHAIRIGLAYQWANLADRLPHELHDVPLDEIITET
jgi:5-formyltetrahydrofolate cyclo-ligase